MTQLEMRRSLGYEAITKHEAKFALPFRQRILLETARVSAEESVHEIEPAAEESTAKSSFSPDHD